MIPTRPPPGLSAGCVPCCDDQVSNAPESAPDQRCTSAPQGPLATTRIVEPTRERALPDVGPHLRDDASPHSRIVRSKLAEANNFPSGENATQ